MSEQTDTRPLLTIGELAARLAISPRSARTLVYGDPRRGKPPAIPSIVIGDGARRIDQRAVDRYVADRQQAEPK